MSLPNPNEFGYFRAGETFPGLAGRTSSAEFDFWRASEVLPDLMPVSFTTWFGAVSLVETVTIATAGTRTTFGAVSLTEMVAITLSGTRTTFGSVSLVETVSISIAGTRTAFGAVSLVETVTITVDGSRTTFGAISLTETVTITVAGQVIPPGPGTVAGKGAATHEPMTVRGLTRKQREEDDLLAIVLMLP